MVRQSVATDQSGLLDEAQVEFLRDLQAFLDYGVRNNLNFLTIMAALGHDVNGLGRYGFDLEAAERDAFRSKVSGYSRIGEEDVGEPDEASG